MTSHTLKTYKMNSLSPAIIFFVFPYFVPASLFIFFILCRLAPKQFSPNRRRRRINFLCIFLLSNCTSALRASDLEIYFFLFIYTPAQRESVLLTSSHACPFTLYSWECAGSRVFCFTINCAGYF